MKYEVWQASDDHKWYWHLRTSSNKVISDGVAYATQEDVIECINQRKGTKFVGIQVVTEHESLYGLVDIFSDTEGLLR